DVPDADAETLRDGVMRDPPHPPPSGSLAGCRRLTRERRVAKFERNALRPAALLDHCVPGAAGDEKLAVALARHFVGDVDSSATDLGDPSPNDEKVVVTRRAAVATGSVDHAEVQAARDIIGKRMAELAKELGPPDLEQPEVARIVHDPHR